MCSFSEAPAPRSATPLIDAVLALSDRDLANLEAVLSPEDVETLATLMVMEAVGLI